MNDNIKIRIKELTDLGERRHTEQVKTGIVHLNEILEPQELQELLNLLRTIPSKQSTDIPLVKFA
jgi:hypothetical protein